MNMIAARHAGTTRLVERVLDKPALAREKAYIDGVWRTARDGGSFEVRDPATGAVIGTVPSMGAAETEEAIAAAARALPHWAARLPQARAAALRRWFEAIQANRDDLARLITLEQGKPLTEAVGEIDYAASFIEWSAEETKRLGGEVVAAHKPGTEMRVVRAPVGVVALITPWNFPSAMITRKAAAALAAGCSCVVHPSGETPYSALALAALAEEAGLPAGLFNVVTGDPVAIVETLCAHDKVRAVSFTGSTHVGRIVAAQAAPGMKRLVLELGGHAPFIVFDDAALDRAVDAAVDAKFATSGQDCLAANRIYVQRGLYDAFVERFAARIAALRLGNGFEDDVDIGPLMNRKGVEKCRAHVEDALAKGARLVVGGVSRPEDGLFFPPTLLADVPADALILEEETFGPVAAVLPFDDEAAVLAAANDTDYGLVAYLFTEDYRRIHRLTGALDYGMVAVNRASITGAPVPFGGVKHSGLGREGARTGVEAFTEQRYICLDVT